MGGSHDQVNARRPDDHMLYRAATSIKIQPGENTTGHYFVNTLLYTILMVFS